MKSFGKIFGVLAVALAFAMTAGHVSAEFKEDYSSAAFEQAQADGKHIVVEVFKQGCGTCAAQQPALEAARAAHPDAVFLKFDFVNNTEAVKRFKVVKQSTIIVFKGNDELARVIGETDKDKLLDLIKQGA
ncbi:MAG: thioredoxin family protein [Pseudomonadota bacterium]